MSILDGGKLGTQEIGRGDDFPIGAELIKVHHKDGVEEPWHAREISVIRGLAGGYSVDTVAKNLSLRPKTIRKWLRNPYFVMEIRRLTDHNLFRYRPMVIRNVAMKAASGSAQHAKLYLTLTKDLKDEQLLKAAHIVKTDDGLERMTPSQLDKELTTQLDSIIGGHPGDQAEDLANE